jgi:hypothetical protein
MADGAALVEVPTTAGAATVVTRLSKPFLKSFGLSGVLSFLFAFVSSREPVIAQLDGLMLTHWLGGPMLTHWGIGRLSGLMLTR